MNSDTISKIFSALALLIVLTFSGCVDDDALGDDEPPIDADPQITVTDPTNGLALLEVGESIQITFQAFDNELLDHFELTEKIISVNGVVVQAETLIPQSDENLFSTSKTIIRNYTVPNVQVFTKIELRGYVRDNKGKEAVTKFTISVVPPQNSGSVYPLQSYSGDTIWSVYTGHDFHFDLFNRRQGDNMNPIPQVNQHLFENSPGGGASFVGVLESPAAFGADSVLVHTSSSVFNFDSLTYQSMYEAFVTSNKIGQSAGDPLYTNDIVILKLLNLPTTHYAAIKITSKNETGGYYTFDYKYSYE